MDSLVEYLADGDHPLVLGGPNASAAELQQRLRDIGYVFLRFTDTQGETELGIRVDQAQSDVSSTDLDRGVGNVHVEGKLVLNSVPVRCLADVDVSTGSGTRHLVVLEQASSDNGDRPH